MSSVGDSAGARAGVGPRCILGVLCLDDACGVGEGRLARTTAWLPRTGMAPVKPHDGANDGLGGGPCAAGFAARGLPTNLSRGSAPPHARPSRSSSAKSWRLEPAVAVGCLCGAPRTQSGDAERAPRWADAALGADRISHRTGPQLLDRALMLISRIRNHARSNMRANHVAALAG